MLLDYYQILQIEPGATAAQIKAAYRKLALQYHPDKNPGDKYALSNFNLVKEAYETLTQQPLRQNYLQRRWASKAQAKEFSKAARTPESILKQFITTNRTVQSMDMFRSDKSAVEESILSLLSQDNIEVLNDFDESFINNQIAELTVQMIHVLKPAPQRKILDQLKKINPTKESEKQLQEAEKFLKQTILFAKFKPWLIALAVSGICFLIWLYGR